MKVKDYMKGFWKPRTKNAIGNTNYMLQELKKPDPNALTNGGKRVTNRLLFNKLNTSRFEVQKSPFLNAD